jgi:hypothetical protein
MNFRFCLNLAAITIAAASASAQWLHVTPSASPSIRSESAMSFEPTLGAVLLFGGVPSFGSPFGDTWSYDGSTWTHLAPATSPGGRGQAGMVYDSNRGVTVLYGGGNTSFFGGPSIDQTWEFDGTTWTHIVPNTTPGGLSLFGIAFDSSRNRVVVYGGDADNSFPIASNGTWEYDGNNWTQMAPANNPGPLERPAMCFDTTRSRVVLFSGIDPQTGGTDETWVYDGTDWSTLPVVGTRPPVRTSGKMVYDASRDVCVLQGGMDPYNGNLINDTWEFDGAAWTQISGPNPTPARWGFAMTVDPVRGKVVAFGGADVNYNVVNATFEYGASYVAFGTGCAGSNGTPSINGVGSPTIGGTLALAINNLATTASATFLYFGFSNTTSSLGALPASLTPFGLTGCTAYISPDLFVLLPASGGSSSPSFSVPNNSSLSGLVLYSQALSLDQGINPAGMTITNGLAATIGR